MRQIISNLCHIIVMNRWIKANIFKVSYVNGLRISFNVCPGLRPGLFLCWALMVVDGCRPNEAPYSDNVTLSSRLQRPPLPGVHPSTAHYKWSYAASSTSWTLTSLKAPWSRPYKTTTFYLIFALLSLDISVAWGISELYWEHKLLLWSQTSVLNNNRGDIFLW